MNNKKRPKIHLRAWRRDDLPLMERLLGDPAMMEHVGGPEAPEQIRKRLERYCSEPTTRMFVIVLKSEPGHWFGWLLGTGVEGSNGLRERMAHPAGTSGKGNCNAGACINNGTCPFGR